ncbi:MAG: hypothetical protein WCI89_01090 [bacterium]
MSDPVWHEVYAIDPVFTLDNGAKVIPHHTYADRLIGQNVRWNDEEKRWEKAFPAETVLNPMDMVRLAVARQFVLGRDLTPPT